MFKNFLWKNKTAIAVCVLTIAFGIGWWALSNPGTTTIGENITAGGRVCDGFGNCLDTVSGGGAKVYSRMGTTNVTITTPNVWATIPDMSVTLPSTFAGGDIYVSFNAILNKNGYLWLRILLDDNQVLNQIPQWDMGPSAGGNLPPGVTLSAAKPNLSAGSHTIKVQWKTDAWFGSDGATYPRSMVVITGE